MHIKSWIYCWHVYKWKNLEVQTDMQRLNKYLYLILDFFVYAFNCLCFPYRNHGVSGIQLPQCRGFGGHSAPGLPALSAPSGPPLSICTVLREDTPLQGHLRHLLHVYSDRLKSYWKKNNLSYCLLNCQLQITFDESGTFTELKVIIFMFLLEKISICFRSIHPSWSSFNTSD